MIWRFEPKVWTIKDIYKYQSEHSTEMLSDITPSLLPAEDFWGAYRYDYQNFDRRFKRLYSSWYPMEQEGLTLAEAASAFRNDCYDHLLANTKRYQELFRIWIIPDNDAYSLVNNVDYHEIIERDIEFQKGRQVNEHDTEIEYGQFTVNDDKEFTYGAQGSETIQTTSAYNESTYTPKDKSETDVDQHIDSQDNQMVYESHTDTTDEDITEGARTDNTDEDTDIHKVGNMGVQTVDDMLKKHWDNWSGYFKFYDLIFKEIAQDLLRGV